MKLTLSRTFRGNSRSPIRQPSDISVRFERVVAQPKVTMGVDEKNLRSAVVPIPLVPRPMPCVKPLRLTPPLHNPLLEETVRILGLKPLRLTYLEFLTVCGILGLLLHDPSTDAAQEISEGLALLQHRGQDACGIITCGTKGRFFQCKANGMVRDVFDENSLSRLIGGMGVGHGQPDHLLFDPNLTHAKSSPLSNCRHF